MKSTRDVAPIAERINNICNQNYIFKGKAFHSGVSIGIALYSSGMKINTLLKQADLALYKSKNSKTNYSFFSEDLEKNFTSEQKLEKYILKAFSKDLFFFHYQPQIDLTTNNINGFEALLRFDLPDDIDATTQDLVNHVRKIGLSEKLNLYAVRKVIEEVGSSGLKGKRISINISPYVKDFLDHIIEVVKIIDKSDLPNSMFELELIEDAFGRIMSLKKNNYISDLLKEKNISLTIDDFGVEYSSINRLIDHHVDALKIDQTFIRTLHKDDRKQIIVKAIIGIAKSLGIKSVAEGVEYQIHEDILKELGCDYVQGYLYSRPLALEEAMQLINKPILKHTKKLPIFKDDD
nr:GGDEF domain-containing phosphodiesterase [Francisella adeliensis]